MAKFDWLLQFIEYYDSNHRPNPSIYGSAITSTYIYLTFYLQLTIDSLLRRDRLAALCFCPFESILF